MGISLVTYAHPASDCNQDSDGQSNSDNSDHYGPTINDGSSSSSSGGVGNKEFPYSPDLNLSRPIHYKYTTSVAAIKFFIDRLTGDPSMTTVVVDPSENPNKFKATPRDLGVMAYAESYFYIGLPFEQGWVQKIKFYNPDVQVVDIALGFPITFNELGSNWRIWTSVRHIRLVVNNILGYLIESDPVHADIYKNNAVKLFKELDELNDYVVNKVKGVHYYATYNSWQYFANEYKLKEYSIMYANYFGGNALSAMFDVAKNNGVKTLIADSEANYGMVKYFGASSGLKVIMCNPTSYEWIESIKCFADAVSQNDF